MNLSFEISLKIMIGNKKNKFFIQVILRKYFLYKGNFKLWFWTFVLKNIIFIIYIISAYFFIFENLNK